MHLLSAACHGCLLIAETSCEQGNDWLEARPCSRRADHRCSRRGLLPVTDCPIPIIRELPERVLIDLVQPLRAGRPTEAATAFMVRYAVPAASEAAVLEMSSLLASGFGPKHAALLLDVIAAERMPHIVTSGLELVTSGPDVTGATCDTGVVLRELFSEAEHRVLVVGLMKFSRPSRIRRSAPVPSRQPAVRADLYRRYYQPGLCGMAVRLRRRQDDHGAARPPCPSLRYHRNR
jgi:hypothetical protein